jgi:two-component system sensor histidine kinase HydH
MAPGESLPLQDWLTLFACVGQLALAALAALRAGTSPLGLPLAWLSVGLFSWNFATLAHRVSGAPEWRYLDVAASPLTIPLTLNFVVGFVGRRRELGRILVTAFAIFVAMGLLSLSALVWTPARAFAGSRLWAGISLVGAVAVVAYTLFLLIEHYRAVEGPEERVRTRLVLSALLVGAALAVTELLADLGLAVPRGGNLGALAAALVLAIVALRFRLLEEARPLRALAYSIALGVLAVVAYLGVFYFLQAHVAMVVLGTVTVTMALLVAARQVVQSHAAERERLQRLAVLGRFSAQMAHDLKNPVAALKGAVQYLEEEIAHGRDLGAHAEFVELMARQIERVGLVVDRYHRLGRIEAVQRPLSLNDVVETVARSQALSRDDGITIEWRLEPDLPPCPADGDLISRAVDNLVRNAREASKRGSTVLVRTESAADRDGQPRVAVVVKDDGYGLAPRAAERAFDDFFTTKSHGSGLGLFFVKRVAEAHGGDVLLSSRPGRGTEARIWLPAA